MDKFFASVGKIFLVLLILGLVAYGSYYFGRSSKDKQKEISNQTSSSDIQLSTTIPLSPTSIPATTVLGGVSKSAGLSYYQYSLNVPSLWQKRREKQTPDMDEKLILEKDGYEIAIFQGATGGAACLYSEDPDFEGPSSTFTSFVELSSKDGLKLRRSGTDIVGKTGKIGFTVCMKSKDGSFDQPTNYGHINYSVPQNYDKDILSEMDKIVSSLTKI